MINTPQQTATILAALRFWQANGQGEGIDEPERFLDIATDGGTLELLDAGAIDSLCDEIDCDEIDATGTVASEAWECLDFVVSLAKESHGGDRDEGLSDHPENDADCYDCRQIALAETLLAGMRDSTVTVEILGGVLSDVSGLLPGQTYTLIDHDGENGETSC